MGSTPLSLHQLAHFLIGIFLANFSHHDARMRSGASFKSFCSLCRLLIYSTQLAGGPHLVLTEDGLAVSGCLPPELTISNPCTLSTMLGTILGHSKLEKPISGLLPIAATTLPTRLHWGGEGLHKFSCLSNPG